MNRTSAHRIRLTTIVAFALMTQVHGVLAENRMTLTKGTNNRIALHLSNTDPIAGFQFSINARGIVLGSYEGTERTASAALGIYQYLKDESTLNVVILAPVRLALSAGDGVIGSISFAVKSVGGEDSIHVSLSNVVVCTMDAKALDVTTGQLTWNKRDVDDGQSKDFTFGQNYPNPFNPSTNISYRLDKPAFVRLTVYDITGRQVRVLIDQNQNEGSYTVKWNADDRSGGTLASGVYIARLNVGLQVATKKMLFAK